MTLLSSSTFPIHSPHGHQRLYPPKKLEAQDVSLIVPVKNNQQGLDALLESITQLQDPSCVPAEILIVDNGSHHPIQIASRYRKRLPIQLLQCDRRGPASARNVGAQHASGCWLWFCDSDCLLTDQSLQGYRQALNGAIGYAGWIRTTLKGGKIRQYYEDQQILIPPHIILETEGVRPEYVITANALVYQPAFQAISGFRETFRYAAGEDIDLGIRLWKVGMLSYAPNAIVYHDFDPDLVSFLKRFIRYGRGNRHLSQMYHVDLTPRRFSPERANPYNWMLAQLQWVGLRIGYALER
jgi:glycosyltransferase involved in cell wall biosynthesis